MNFTYKNEADLSQLTAEQRDKYAADKRAYESEITKTQIEETVTKTTSETKKSLKDLTETVKQLQEQSSKKTSQSKTVAEELNENKDALKAIASKASNGEVVVKALLQRSAIDGNVQAFELPDIGQLATRKLTMYDVFPKLTIAESNNNGNIGYYDWDEATIVRAAASVAEGTAFPESTAKFKRYTTPLQKIGDSMPVTEEFLEDEQMFAAELGLFLETNVKVVMDTDLATGDGTGAKIKGLLASIDAFTPVASGIADASIYDLVVKVSESITKTGGSKYTPNVAFMNITDINKMKLKKDLNNNYVIPPFATVGGQVVDGITVIESNNLTANTMVVGDRRYARIYEKGGIVLSQGLVGTQFTEDEMTLKVRKRMAFLIRNSDKGGWKKVTSITAALTTLAT